MDEGNLSFHEASPFQRPVEYDPTLARRLAQRQEAVAAVGREAGSRESLRKELGLSDDDDGDNCFAAHREARRADAYIVLDVELLRLRYLGCVRELQLVHARERRTIEQLARARQLAKSQSIIMWRTYTAKLQQKNNLVRKMLGALRKHALRHGPDIVTTGSVSSCAVLADVATTGHCVSTLGPINVPLREGTGGANESPRTHGCGLVTDHVLKCKMECYERENVLLRATVRHFGLELDGRKTKAEFLERCERCIARPVHPTKSIPKARERRKPLPNRSVPCEPRAKAERAKLRKAVRIAKAVKVKLAHANARQQQLEQQNQDLVVLLKNVRTHICAGDLTACRRAVRHFYGQASGGDGRATASSLPTPADKGAGAETALSTHSIEQPTLPSAGDPGTVPQRTLASSAPAAAPDLHGALQEAKTRVGKLEKQVEECRACQTSLEKENVELHGHAKEEATHRRELGAALHTIRSECRRLKIGTSAMRHTIRHELGRMKALHADTLNAVCASMQKLIGASNAVVANYRREKAERRRLFNVVQELRGNIRVFCRVRPLTAGESARGAASSSCVHFDDADDGTVTIVNPKNGRKRSWEFDKVFQPTANNSVIFDEVRELCTSILDGYNVCIFAYGQTGSGKTYTMEGPESDRGVNFRALSRIFENMKGAASDTLFDVSVSLLEIYNEEIRDLLAEQVGAKSLHVRQGRHGNVVPELTVVPVQSWREVSELMDMGYTNRATAYTSSNEHSSRSHCILNVAVASTNLATGQKTRGQLHLVDLAGSERMRKSGVSGQRMKEALNINKSLSALGDVIQSRVNKTNHVPFRNSTLTHLLQDSLSKDSKTVMIVQVSPSRFHVDESFSSLNFAARAKSAELGRSTGMRR